jgi:hypothetical protein
MGGNESWNFMLRGGILGEEIWVIEIRIGTLGVKLWMHPGRENLLNFNKL